MKYFKNILPIFLLAIGITSCDVQQTKEGELPDVDISAEAGTLPEFDVDWMDVNVGTKTKTITVPTVEVVMEEKTVEVPYIETSWPDEKTKLYEQTIMVEAEISNQNKSLEIDKIYAKGDRLIVVSSLETTEESLGDKSIRVSDQVVIKAPDLTVKHYIIGDKPNRSFNNNYSYIKSNDDIASKIDGAKVIFG